MGFFKKAFKAIGRAGKSVLSVSKPLLGLAAGFLPGVGPAVSSLVSKLIPDAAPQVQEQAFHFIESAATAQPLTAQAAIQQAGELKQALLSVGVPSEQASSLGAVLKVAAEASPGTAPVVLAQVDNQLPANSLAAGFTKNDVKVLVNGALEGAKNGAVDAYLDKTENGKETKAAAVNTQGQKYLPYLMLAGMVALWFAKNKDNK